MRKGFHSAAGPPAGKPCNCLKKQYWSDPSQATCAKRPAATPALPASYLDKWAFEGDDCSAKPCFNFDANTKVPLQQDYKGTPAFVADFPNKAFTGRMSAGGYSSLQADGNGAGYLEALSCRGRVTQSAPWWKWWESDTVDYKCVLRSSDAYAARKTPCSCPWWKWFGCTGDDPACGKHGQCFLTTMDMQKYCQPRHGQNLCDYGLGSCS